MQDEPGARLVSHVSTDGRFLAFQIAQGKDEAGVGYGIMLYHFNARAK